MITCYICGTELPEIDETYPYVDLDELNNVIYFCSEKCHRSYYI